MIPTRRVCDYIELHIQDVAVYIPPNDEQPINQLRCDPHSGNLLMLVREVIYYIDYPKERRPAALTLKMCSTRNRLPQLIYFILWSPLYEWVITLCCTSKMWQYILAWRTTIVPDCLRPILYLDNIYHLFKLTLWSILRGFIMRLPGSGIT